MKNMTMFALRRALALAPQPRFHSFDQLVVLDEYTRHEKYDNVCVTTSSVSNKIKQYNSDFVTI